MAAATVLALAAALVWTGVADNIRSAASALLSRRRTSPQEVGDIWAVLVESIATGVRSGAAPALACAAACRAATDLLPATTAAQVEQLRASAESGDELAAAWQRIADELGDAGLRAVAAGWRLSETVGTPLAQALTVAAALRRSEIDRSARMKAALAAPTTSVNLLTVLPVGGALLGVALGADVWSVYLSPLAAVTVLPGVLLILVGRWWCRRMVAGAGRSRSLA